jgi:dCMP deaminase
MPSTDPNRGSGLVDASKLENFIETHPTRSQSKELVFIEIAYLLGGLSTCDRKHVGAVIVRNGRCISWGFNGAPPGMPHCSENYHGWRDTYLDPVDPPAPVDEDNIRIWSERQARDRGCRNVTHAEANALAFAAREGISTDRGTLFVTVSPCEVCARLLIAAGIERVMYYEEYRDPRGVEILKEGGVQVG